jgi:AbrB family transcriptional regulator (stage V sporulation protein T)
MKATGIVRRVDDLGRVVIPKEIRRSMRIREGDPLEIYTERGGEVIFKKYSPVGDLEEHIQSALKALSRMFTGIIVVFDRDCIVAVSGAPKKDFVSKAISEDIFQLLDNRIASWSLEGALAPIPLLENYDSPFVEFLVPISVEGEILGGIAIIKREELITSEVGRCCVEVIAKEISYSMET